MSGLCLHVLLRPLCHERGLYLATSVSPVNDCRASTRFSRHRKIDWACCFMKRKKKKRLRSQDFHSPPSRMENGWQSILAQGETRNIEPQVKGEGGKKTISLTSFSALRQCDARICVVVSVLHGGSCVLRAPNLTSQKAFPSKGRSIEANWSRSLMSHTAFNTNRFPCLIWNAFSAFKGVAR